MKILFVIQIKIGILYKIGKDYGLKYIGEARVPSRFTKSAARPYSNPDFAPLEAVESALV